MPFTLSHAAAVLPAIRRDGGGRGRLVPAVLVAGSYAPDMPYYTAGVLPGGMQFGTVTHAFAGVVTVDVPIAWALAGLWLLVREPLTALLPRAWQGRPAALLRCGAPRARVRAASVGRWYASAVLGALTHVVWDAFTHHDRWGTRLIAAIGRERPAGMPLFTWLQYGSSVAGAVVVAVFLVRALRRAPDAVPARVPVLSARDRWYALALIGGCALAGAAQRTARWREQRGTAAGPWELVPTLCFGVGAGVLLGLLLYAAGVRVWRPAAVRGEPGPSGEVVGTSPQGPVAR
ncbi:hypothetical protein GCM10018980_41200 [Streptomyces capoamus]|uniref:DUF4184 family protein n=1 Tax=Streptomyces capoamus TaxID=68183 RepID=A0A919EXF1_9ACTN|nr:DUF4184 family protein [Streptomyces capoamus]GGW18814.1 hypothetical protein GCM10010501_49700 [Streptomyces libani subsp. rufus]GHG55785.1 hypothetical protein GCM10018980_41200 [Streptomyces capoamus]